MTQEPLNQPRFVVPELEGNNLPLFDGWLEGGGVAPKPDNLKWLSNAVAHSFPESLKSPSVAPTEDGNIIFEWIFPHARIELEVNFADKKLELYATHIKSNDFVEREFGIDQWKETFAHVEELLLL